MTPSKLLICGLFQKGRVLAQDGVATFLPSGSRMSILTSRDLKFISVDVRHSPSRSRWPGRRQIVFSRAP